MALRNFTRLIQLKCTNVQLSEICLYSRWSHRRPARVLLQTPPSTLEKEEIIDLNPQDLEAVKNITQQANQQKETISRKIKDSSSVKQLKIIHDEYTFESDKKQSKISRNECTFENDKKQTKINHDEYTFESDNIIPPQVVDGEKIKKRRADAQKLSLERLKNESVFDENGEIKYQTLKENDGRISTILTNLKVKKGRSKTNQVLVEGWRLIVDGLQANCKLRYVMFSRVSDLELIKSYLPKSGVKLFKIPYDAICMWSNVDTSPGMLGVFELPDPELIKATEKPLPLQIICDNVRDPGNLGAILRASVGVGCKNVLLMKGCVDLWDSKVIRSAAGAHFRLPIHRSLEWPQVQNLVKPNSSVIIADNNFKVELSSHRFGQADGEEMESLERLDVPCIPYYSMDYSALNSVTLIVGGETEGISEESYRFAAARKGLRVNIPLQKGVDSLNTGMATAVIVFEIKKQILEAKALENSAVQ